MDSYSSFLHFSGNIFMLPIEESLMLFSINVLVSLLIVDTKRDINPETSFFGLCQFSVEKAYSVK